MSTKVRHFLKLRLGTAVLALVLAASVLSGCGGGGTGSSATLTYAVGTDAQTLDPQFVTDIPSAVAVMQIHETLVARDENMNFIPGLATEWSVAEDGCTWTFKLRQGVKFHDGADFNAEAVKYNFDRILDPATGSPRRSVASMIKEVKVVGPYEVQIITNDPYGPMLAQISSYNLAIISPKSGAELGKGYAQKPAGTGPFKLKSWTPGQSLVLERFDGYWGDKPKVREIEFKVVPEDGTRTMLLKTGGADVVAGVPAFELENLKKDPNVNLIMKPGFRTIYVGMNCSKEPFDDPRVRQAVNYAIDREAIVNYVLRGAATVGVGPESPAIPGAAKNLVPYTYNPEKAKQLLKEAGYPNGFKTVFHTPSGRYPMDQQVAEAVVGQLKEVGIDAELQILDWGAYQAMLDKAEESRLFLLGKGSPSGDPDMTLTLSFGTNEKMNSAKYSNPEVDELIKQQRVCVDPVERQQILQTIQEKIHADAPWAVLYYEQILIGTRSNVKGLQVLPNEIVLFKGVSVEK